MRPFAYPSALLVACLTAVPIIVQSFAAPVVLTIPEFEQQYEIRSWGTEDGLPDARVTAITQTHDGYLWIATPRGLVRFDGLRFTVFDRHNTPEFSDDNCVVLAESTRQELWIAARTCVFRKTGHDFVKYDARVTGGWSPMCMAPSRSGGMWVGAKTRALHFNPDRVSVQAYSVGKGMQRSNAVRALLEDDTGDLWIGSFEGLFRLRPGEAEAKATPLGTELESWPTYGLRKTRQGEIWVNVSASTNLSDLHPYGYVGSLGCFRAGKWVKSPDPTKAEFEMLNWSAYLVEDPFGALWFPSLGRGLHRYAAGKIDYVPFPDPKSGIGICAFSDREGNLWVGTPSHGLQRWAPRRAMTYTTREGLIHEDAWSICEAADGSIWIGTEGGVSQLKNGRFTNFPMPAEAPESKVRAIVQDTDGLVWFGTMRALHCLQEGQIRTTTFPGDWYENKVRALLPAREGGIWVGTVCGLTFLRDGQHRKYTRKDGLGIDEVRSILEGKDGALWVGTFGGGLSRLQQGRFTTLTTTNGLSNNRVWALHQDKAGVLWAGTEHGLNRIEEDRIAVFRTSEGLPANKVYCILEDDHGRLWISCDRGIYWVWKRQLEDVAAKRVQRLSPVLYTAADGLPSVETNGEKCNPAGLKSRDGTLWFPTPRGVVMVDPAKAVLDEVPPIAALEMIRVDGRLIAGSSPADREEAAVLTPLPEPGEVGSLPQGGLRVLEFRYTANTFQASDKARFKYRLVGLSDAWINAETRREAHFNELRPGKYRFEVIAGNHRGVWQTQPTAVSFLIKPYFYQTWWFYSVCVLGVLAFAYAGVRWRVGELRTIEALERLDALSEQRKRIAEDIHDDLGAALTHIVQITHEPLPDQAHPQLAAARTERIAAIAEEAVDNISEIVWANNSEYDTLDDLLSFIREYAARFFNESSLKIVLDFPEVVAPAKVAGLFRRQLLLVVKEALQNVMKHACAKAVRLSSKIEAGRLELTIEDDGGGFDGNGSGNGLGNMRHRVAAVGGVIQIQSKTGCGTRICVSVPLPEADRAS